MAIPKKGTRKILIKEDLFIWLVRRQGTNMQLDYPDRCLHVAVEHSQEPGSTLVIVTDRLHPKGYRTHGALVPVQPQEQPEKVQSWNIKRRYAITPVTPSDVASWVQQALQMGWQPRKSGPPFVIKVVDQCLEKI